jgi:hypothetical protein
VFKTLSRKNYFQQQIARFEHENRIKSQKKSKSNSTKSLKLWNFGTFGTLTVKPVVGDAR